MYYSSDIDDTTFYTGSTLAEIELMQYGLSNIYNYNNIAVNKEKTRMLLITQCTLSYEDTLNVYILNHSLPTISCEKRARHTD